MNPGRALDPTTNSLQPHGALEAAAAWLSAHPGRAACFFLLAGLLPVFGCLNAPLLLAYDDVYWTVRNPLLVHGWSAFGELLAFPFRPATGEGFQTAHWAPVSLASLALEHALFGQASHGPPGAEHFAPWAFRLSQAMQHGLAGCCVAVLGRRLTGRAGPGLFAALLFLWHPTVCESVCWIGARTTQQAILLGLAALVVYSGGDAQRGPGWARVAAASAILLLAQGTKGVAVAWWAVLVAWDLLLYAEAGRRKQLARAAALLPALLWTFFVIRKSHADLLLPPLGEGVFGPWLMSAYLFMRHLGLLVGPVGLSVYYEVPVAGLDLGAGRYLAAGGVSLAIAAWLSIRLGIPKSRVALYALWMAAGIAPMIGPFAQLSLVLQDRYTYLALPAFALWLAEGLSLLAAARPRLSAAFVAVVLALCAGLAVQRSTLWRDTQTLVRDGADKAPGSAYGHAYLAHLLFHGAADEKDPDRASAMRLEARERFERALRCADFDRMIYPLALQAEYAHLCAGLDDWPAAQAAATAVWNARAERPTERGAKLTALRLLAADAFRRGATEEGLAFTESGLALAPDLPELLRNRLQAWVDLKRADRARAEAERLAAHPELGPFARAVLKQIDSGL
ncbi:MAG: hypothetical protein HS116_13160 [Planctomycetes bacterium]|nr:hypothetical protein [Planctomycetota bacterium]